MLTILRACGSALWFLLVPSLAFAALPDLSGSNATAKPSRSANFDARVNNRTALATAVAARPAATAVLHAQLSADAAASITARGKAAADFRSRFAAATVEFSPGTLAPETVYSNAGALTAPSSAPSFDIAKNYLRTERAPYGLSAADIDALDLIGACLIPSGLRMLRVRQVVNGRPVS